MFWQIPEGNTTWFFDEVTKRLLEYRLDTNAPRAARAYALMAVTKWDQIRPSKLDPTVPLLFPPPERTYRCRGDAVHYRRIDEEMGRHELFFQPAS